MDSKLHMILSLVQLAGGRVVVPMDVAEAVINKDLYCYEDEHNNMVMEVCDPSPSIKDIERLFDKVMDSNAGAAHVLGHIVAELDKKIGTGKEAKMQRENEIHQLLSRMDNMGLIGQKLWYAFHKLCKHDTLPLFTAVAENDLVLIDMVNKEFPKDLIKPWTNQ